MTNSLLFCWYSCTFFILKWFYLVITIPFKVKGACWITGQTCPKFSFKLGYNCEAILASISLESAIERIWRSWTRLLELPRYWKYNKKQNTKNININNNKQNIRLIIAVVKCSERLPIKYAIRQSHTLAFVFSCRSYSIMSVPHATRESPIMHVEPR